jgi:hypothetical protein
MDPSQLRDIHVQMGQTWWPPAPGWWLLVAALVGIGLLLWRYDPRWRLYVPLPIITLGTWRWEAAQALRALRRRLDDAPVKPIATELSELLRRIAMARHGRAACAGLHGEDWLAWLTEHDPKGFDWSRDARPLLSAPYDQPAAANTQRAAIGRILSAAMEWVAAPDPKPTRDLTQTRSSSARSPTGRWQSLAKLTGVIALRRLWQPKRSQGEAA